MLPSRPEKQSRRHDQQRRTESSWCLQLRIEAVSSTHQLTKLSPSDGEIAQLLGGSWQTVTSVGGLSSCGPAKQDSFHLASRGDAQNAVGGHDANVLYAHLGWLQAGGALSHSTQLSSCRCIRSINPYVIIWHTPLPTGLSSPPCWQLEGRVCHSLCLSAGNLRRGTTGCKYLFIRASSVGFESEFHPSAPWVLEP